MPSSQPPLAPVTIALGRALFGLLPRCILRLPAVGWKFFRIYRPLVVAFLPNLPFASRGCEATASDFGVGNLGAASVLIDTGVHGSGGRVLPKLRRWWRSFASECGALREESEESEFADEDEEVEAVERGAFGEGAIGEVLPFDGGSLSRSLRVGTRVRLLRRSLTPRSSRALVDMPTLFLGGRPRGRPVEVEVAVDVVTLCLFGDGSRSSASSVRCRLTGRLSAVDIEREPDTASESLWFIAARDLCDK